MSTIFPWSHVWIVGGSSGIGAEAVKLLAENGVDVTVSARSKDALKELADLDDHIRALPLDITDMDACVDAVNGFETLPDLIILNAAVYEPMAAHNFDGPKAAWMMDVNYNGFVKILDPLLKRYHDRDGEGGRLAIVTSPSGYRGLPGGTGYGPTKAALINLAESIRPEMQHWGADVSIVNPGFVRTRLTGKNKFKMPQLLEADDAAGRMLKGLAKGKWNVAFPYPFLGLLRFLAKIPSGLYFAYARSIAPKN